MHRVPARAPVAAPASIVPGPAPDPAPTAHRPPRGRAFATVAALLPMALTACGGSAGPAAQNGASPVPSQNVLRSVHKDEAAAKLLPRDVRKRGSLRLATSVGSPPSAYHPDTATKKPVGQDVDIGDAVGKVLGLKVKRDEASFETILPALTSGKYDAGTGNFGVTDERRRTIDFVTYINDGQGFAVRKDDKSLRKVTRLSQLCGKTVGTGAGTTFEETLDTHKDVCKESGEKPYTVRVFSDDGAELTSLQQGRVDVTMSTINGLRHQAAQPAAGIRFLGEFQRLDVGFAFAKGSPLTKAFQTAVNRLIKDGTYDRILRKWGTEKSAIPVSRISPPEKK
ncbi:polar amino acid transport system substrate-binding protein [Streptomyces sp. Amel2xB2]|nr:polar amino acid transport system substrate-binding protein [Streptomyces sp. Amel2xB2]